MVRNSSGLKLKRVKTNAEGMLQFNCNAGKQPVEIAVLKE